MTADIVLRGGRVIDPETGLDQLADVAISGGQITEVGAGLGPAPVSVDVAGQVVTAGFIDLHSHTNDIPGLRLRVLDGVTTALELEAGVLPVSSAYREAAAEGRPGWRLWRAWSRPAVSSSLAACRRQTFSGLPRRLR
jgi:N-acyl-D-aspartate/D-glutamate deacylase